MSSTYARRRCHANLPAQEGFDAYFSPAGICCPDGRPSGVIIFAAPATAQGVPQCSPLYRASIAFSTSIRVARHAAALPRCAASPTPLRHAAPVLRLPEELASFHPPRQPVRLPAAASLLPQYVWSRRAAELPPRRRPPPALAGDRERGVRARARTAHPSPSGTALPRE